LEDVLVAMRAIVLRHGQSSFNVQGKIQGRSDRSVLTEKGQKDAGAAGRALAGIDISAIYCSPLQRARQTAQIAISGLETPLDLQPDPDLMEIDLPFWENMIQAEVKEKYPQEYQTWKNQPHKFTLDDRFYPVLSLYEQATKFWQRVVSQHQGQTILIVAHNGINRALISTALGISPDRYHSIQQSNCGISILNFAGGWGEQVQLESLNQTSHMGEALPTFRPNADGPRLLIIRHGETDWNRAGKFQGQIDIPLNDYGRHQASLAAEFLRDVGIDFAYTSPMSRPKETAEIILNHHQGIQLREEPDFREIGHGLWEGKFETEIATAYPEELDRWRTVPESVQMPEGENLQDVWTRSIAAWQKMLAEIGDRQQTGIVVAHDATNKLLLCYLLGLNLPDFWKIKQGNGAVTVVDYPQGIGEKPVIQALNLTSHLSGSILDRTAAGAL
jgi:phosphoserine phosphatase